MNYKQMLDKFEYLEAKIEYLEALVIALERKLQQKQEVKLPASPYPKFTPGTIPDPDYYYWPRNPNEVTCGTPVNTNESPNNILWPFSSPWLKDKKE